MLDQQYKVENFSKDLPREYLQDLCIARMLVYLFELEVLPLAKISRKSQDADAFLCVSSLNPRPH